MRNKLLFITVFQIFILATMLFANSFQIHQLDLIQSVSAEETLLCCPKTNDGAICQDVVSDYSECAENLQNAKCEAVADCKSGCCVDDKEGLCTTGAPRAKCEDDGGLWKDDKNCNLFECQKGCCVFGDEVQFITDKRCGQLSLIFGFEKDFRDLETEFECLTLSENQPEGACVFEGGNCKFATENECRKFRGAFSVGNLCSKESLNTTCEKQDSISCIGGKDEIYWLDSCGNKENIYSSNKDFSWNEGKVLGKENSCGAGSSNANSLDCGNCNHYLGSRCSESSLLGNGVKDGDFVCENLNCVDQEGKERLNGESWCVYDSFIGDGKDTVGSRHWKRMCIDGEVKVEPCADYRGQICVQAEINGTEKSFTTAACVINEATKCLNYNSKQDMKSCEANEYCVKKGIDVDSGFKFDVCVGAYPKGFDLTGEEFLESQDVCGMASQKCEVLYVKDWKGKWNCENNCNCESSDFTEQMNDLCVSLGDCGTYVNYVGDGTDSSNVENAPGVSWENYKEYAGINESQFAKPKKISQVLETMNGGGSNSGIGSAEQEEEGFAQGVKLLGTISSASGGLISGASYFGLVELMTIVPEVVPGLAYTTATTIGSIGTAAAGVGIGILVGSLATKAFGIQGHAATALALAGGVAGGVAGLGATGALGSTIGGFSTFGGAITSSTSVLGTTLGSFAPMLAALVWAIIVAVVLAIVFKIIGWGDTKTVVVKFECRPWEAPLGNANCEKCDDDILKPCSEYKCESLGQACKLLNEDSENPVCEGVDNDGKSPIISTGNIAEGFEFVTGNLGTGIKEKGQKCVTEFKPVLFSLNTDEYAQCKYSFEKTSDYGNMEKFPIEQNMFSENHTFGFYAPSVDSIKTYNPIVNLSEMYADMKIYIRCQDYYGNYNLKEYVVNFCVTDGPDLTPPNIVATNPKQNSYLQFGVTEKNLDVYVNEPAECRVDSIDRSYEYMKDMTCYNDLLQYTDFGWRCSTTLTGVNAKENNFYIRCKDQPWMVNDTITELNNETNVTTVKMRNVNSESFVITLKSSTSALKIDSVSPSGEISGGFEPITVELNARTSGGSEDGYATCYYRFSEEGEEALFFDTYSNVHEQVFNSMMKGGYNIWVRCEDDAGNVAEESTNFVLNLDTSAPIVARVYYEDGKIKLITNEEAECYYDFNKCNFDIANASSMTTAFSTRHNAEKISGQTYYIQCLDIWGNKGDGCSIKVRSFE